MFYVVKYFIF